MLSTANGIAMGRWSGVQSSSSNSSNSSNSSTNISHSSKCRRRHISRRGVGWARTRASVTLVLCLVCAQFLAVTEGLDSPVTPTSSSTERQPDTRDSSDSAPPSLRKGTDDRDSSDSSSSRAEEENVAVEIDESSLVAPLFSEKQWIGDYEEIRAAHQYHRSLAKSRDPYDGTNVPIGAGKGTTWLFDDDHTNHFYDFYKPEQGDDVNGDTRTCVRMVKKIYKRDKVVTGVANDDDPLKPFKQCMGCKRGDSESYGPGYDTGDAWIKARAKCPSGCQKRIDFLYEWCDGVTLPPGFYWDAGLTQNGPWDDALQDWLRTEIALCGCSAAQSNRTSGLAWNAMFLILAVVASWNFGFDEGPFPFLMRLL